MTIQTDPDGSAPGDNYTVLRGRRDVLGTSDVGAIFLSRQSTSSGDYNRVYGADANFRFVRALSINGFLAKSETPGVTDGQMSGKGSIVWNDNFLHTQYSLLVGRRQLPRRHRLRQAAPASASTSSTSASGRGRRRCASTASASCTRTRATTSTPISRTTKLTHTNHVAMSVFFENGAQRRIRREPALRTDRGAVPDPAGSVVCGRAATTGTEYSLLGRDEPQPDDVGRRSIYHRRVLVGNAAVNQARGDRAGRRITCSSTWRCSATTSTCRFRCMPS